MTEILTWTLRAGQRTGGRIFRPLWAVVDRRLFRAAIERLDAAASEHQANDVPDGDPVYKRLYAEALQYRSQFVGKWGGDIPGVYAHHPGLEHLRRLAGADRP